MTAWFFLWAFAQAQAFLYFWMWRRSQREIESLSMERDHLWDAAHGIGSRP